MKIFKKFIRLIGQSFKKLIIKMYPSLIAVSIGLVIGFIVMLFFNPSSAGSAFIQLLLGGTNNGSVGIGNTLYGAAPIILTGLAVAFAFKTFVRNQFTGQIY